MIQNFQNLFNGLALPYLILLGVFCSVYLLRLLYLFLFSGRILFQKKEEIKQADPISLSLILWVRNEEENLKNNLPKILSLENNSFEVVVVDDFSQDNSYLVLGLLKERYKRLKISVLNQETKYSTKISTNIALKATSNEWVLPIPVTISNISDSWLKRISTNIKDDKTVVFAYSNIERSKGFFNHLCRIEGYFQHQKSVAFILNHLSFVYSEENVAFQKKKYFEAGGFAQKVIEPYANLELILNSFIRKKETTILFEKESAIRKNKKACKGDYLELLKKSIRIESHLTFPKQAVLAFNEFTKLIFAPLAIASIALYFELWPIFSGLLGFQFVSYLLIINISQKRLNERKIFISSLTYDFIRPYFVLFYRWDFNLRRKKNRWRSKV